MHRLIATIVLFKFVVLLVVFSTTGVIDPALLTSCILMAISAAIIKSVQEGEVALILMSLILLIDSIGLLISLISINMLVPIVSYIFLIIWDIQILLILRQIL